MKRRYDNHTTAVNVRIAFICLTAISAVWMVIMVVDSWPDISDLRGIALGLSLVNLNIYVIYKQQQHSFVELTEEGFTVGRWLRSTRSYGWAEIQEIVRRGREYVIHTDDGKVTLRRMECAGEVWRERWRKKRTQPLDEIVEHIRRNAPPR